MLLMNWNCLHCR